MAFPSMLFLGDSIDRHVMSDFQGLLDETSALGNCTNALSAATSLVMQSRISTRQFPGVSDEGPYNMDEKVGPRERIEEVC